jgi:hypothetical protein
MNRPYPETFVIFVPFVVKIAPIAHSGAYPNPDGRMQYAPTIILDIGVRRHDNLSLRLKWRV